MVPSGLYGRRFDDLYQLWGKLGTSASFGPETRCVSVAAEEKPLSTCASGESMRTGGLKFHDAIGGDIHLLTAGDSDSPRCIKSCHTGPAHHLFRLRAEAHHNLCHRGDAWSLLDIDICEMSLELVIGGIG